MEIVHTSNGDLEKLQKLVALAKRDYRDLIVAAEYELKDGKLAGRRLPPE